MLDRFVEAGGTLIDTADTYGDGESERVLAPWLARHRDEVVRRHQGAIRGQRPARGGPRARPDPRGVRRQPAPPRDRRHRPLPGACARPDRAAGGDARSARRAGAGRQGARARRVQLPGLAARLGGRAAGSRRLVAVREPAAAVLAGRALAEIELLPFTRAAGLGVLPWGPLGAGFLSGRYRRGERCRRAAHGRRARRPRGGQPPARGRAQLPGRSTPPRRSPRRTARPCRRSRSRGCSAWRA